MLVHCSNFLQSLAPHLVRFLMLLSMWHLPRHRCYPCLSLRCSALRRCKLSCSKIRHLAILQGAAIAPRDRQESWRGLPSGCYAASTHNAPGRAVSAMLREEPSLQLCHRQ